MRTGATISGGAHAALIGAMLVSGAFLSEPERRLTPLAEVTLMSGAEFQAAFSAAPEFDAEKPASPATPVLGEDYADVQVAPEDAAPTRPEVAGDVSLPEPSADVDPLAEPAAPAHLATVGDRLAGPLAPDGDRLIAASDAPAIAAPVNAPTAPPPPDPRPATPAMAEPEPQAPAAPPQTEIAAPAPRPEDKAPDPAPKEEQVAAFTPPAPQSRPERAAAPAIDTSSPEPPEETAEPAPEAAPPPPRQTAEAEVAREAEREARPAAKPEKTGAQKQAEATRSTGTTRSTAPLSDVEIGALTVGIKDHFTTNSDVLNADELVVVLQINVGEDGRIVGKPRLLSPLPPLDRAHQALASDGARALLKAEQAGVFAKLPKDKYDRWRLIDVTFTPREIKFL